MEKTISINDATCIKCGKCVRVCPSRLFSQDSSSSVTVTVQGCICCGHCTAACPTDSVIHSDFPQETIHKIDYAALPTPEQLLLLSRVRRSNRAFSGKPIPAGSIELILEAAHRAPTASNMQQVEFTLVTDPALLRAISNYTVDLFSSIVRKLTNPLLKPILKLIIPGVYNYLPAFDRLMQEWANGNDMVLRGATAVIFIHTPGESRFGCQDANLAYQNGSLMAESLGVSQFYTGFVCSAYEQDKSKKLTELLGINGKIHAGMALGMPSFRFPNYIDKKAIKVNRR